MSIFRRNAGVVAVMVVVFGSAAAHAAGLELPLLWTANLETYTESGATVADIDGDALEEIVVAGREEVIALDGTGKELWRWHTKGRLMTYPSVLPRAGKPSLIYAADTSGSFICLDGAGAVVWQAQLGGPSSWSAPVVCDLEADGGFEVVQTDEPGTVRAFDALTGQPIWQTTVQGMPGSVAVGDLDGDGHAELAVVTGDGQLVALDSKGERLWDYDIGGTSETWATSSPVVFAASDGGGRVVAASNEGRIFCFDRDGNVLWERPTRGPVASTISVGDFDLDGVADVFVITQLGVVYRFDENGRKIWDIDMQGRSLAAGAIIDLDGDGRLEYALSTQNGHLLVLNQAGEFVFDWQFDNRTINVTPAFGDVTPESPGLEMVITGGEAGLTFCFGTPAPVDALAQWDAYRGDERKSGAWFGLRSEDTLRIVPVDLAWDRIFSGEPVRFIVTNPTPGDQPLVATVTCVGPDGTRQVATSPVAGKRIELLMPVDAVAPGTYRFSWRLTDGAGHTRFSGGRDVVLTPFANDQAIAIRAVAAAEKAAEQADEVLPAFAVALRREASALDHRLEAVKAVQTAAPASNELLENAIETSAALVRAAKRVLHIVETVAPVLQLGSRTSLVAFEGTKWENRAVNEQIPDGAENPLKIERKVVRGEHTSIALGLFNVTERPLQARLVVDEPEGGPRVTAHRSVPVPTSLGELSWDPLPRLDESRVITVPSLETGELWLDIDAGQTAAGDHQITVRVQALNGAGVTDGPSGPQTVAPPEAVVEVALKILPFDMAASDRFYLCAWARLDGPAIADMIAHGNNVFIGPHGKPLYNEDGALAGFDYADLDAFTAPFIGEKVMPLLSGIPAFRAELGSPEYARDLKVYLDDLVPHMAAKGFDTDHFALYPLDEPGGHGWHAIDQMVAFGKAVRAANPDVMVYVDGGGELPMFEAMGPYIDIWCPGIMMLAEDTPEMAVVRSTGKMLWSYDCGYGYARPTGPNIKNINVAGQFRTAALFALRHDATGIGYWCYNIGGDPWGRDWNEYPLVYPGPAGPVTSRRWEAVREGIEDYRILAALQDRLESGDVDGEAAEQIRDLLEVRLPALIDEGFIAVKLGLARHVLDATNNDAIIAAFRAEIMACVEMLCKP